VRPGGGKTNEPEELSEPRTRNTTATSEQPVNTRLKLAPPPGIRYTHPPLPPFTLPCLCYRSAFSCRSSAVRGKVPYAMQPFLRCCRCTLHLQVSCLLAPRTLTVNARKAYTSEDVWTLLRMTDTMTIYKNTTNECLA